MRLYVVGIESLVRIADTLLTCDVSSLVSG